MIEAVATYSAYIYATCGLVALYQIYKIWQVRGERRQAVFSLEREKAIRDLYGIFYVALLLVLIMAATYFTSTTLAVAVEPIVEEARNPQPELPFVPTPTSTPLPVTPTVPVTPTLSPFTDTQVIETPVAPTPVILVTPTVAAPQQVVQAPSCPDNRAVISSPGNGETVSGVVNIIGTASHERFQYYKVEFAPGANAQAGFVYLGGGSSQVVNGVLTSVDTSALGSGTWTLRIVVVDLSGNFPPPCTVTIDVAG